MLTVNLSDTPAGPFCAHAHNLIGWIGNLVTAGFTGTFWAGISKEQSKDDSVAGESG